MYKNTNERSHVKKQKNSNNVKNSTQNQLKNQPKKREKAPDTFSPTLTNIRSGITV